MSAYCVSLSFSKISFLVDRLLSMQKARVDPARAAGAVEELHSGRMTFHAAAKTFYSVGSLQNCVYGSARKKADMVGPGSVLSICHEK